MTRSRHLNTKFLQRDVKRSSGWAWAVHDGPTGWQLVHWAEPTKEQLLRSSKPSPEARPVRVVIIPQGALYRLPTPEAPALSENDG
jgi:hypothetical protein